MATPFERAAEEQRGTCDLPNQIRGLHLSCCALKTRFLLLISSSFLHCTYSVVCPIFTRFVALVADTIGEPEHTVLSRAPLGPDPHTGQMRALHGGLFVRTRRRTRPATARAVSRVQLHRVGRRSRAGRGRSRAHARPRRLQVTARGDGEH